MLEICNEPYLSLQLKIWLFQMIVKLCHISSLSFNNFFPRGNIMYKNGHTFTFSDEKTKKDLSAK